jgi:DNA-directed RNA polymerase subunit RPC12/RpoP
MIAFKCPHCQQPLEAPEEMAGDSLPCPTCSKAIMVPGSDAAPITPPPYPASEIAPPPFPSNSATPCAPRTDSLITPPPFPSPSALIPPPMVPQPPVAVSPIPPTFPCPAAPHGALTPPPYIAPAARPVAPANGASIPTAPATAWTPATTKALAILVCAIAITIIRGCLRQQDAKAYPHGVEVGAADPRMHPIPPSVRELRPRSDARVSNCLKETPHALVLS